MFSKKFCLLLIWLSFCTISAHKERMILELLDWLFVEQTAPVIIIARSAADRDHVVNSYLKRFDKIVKPQLDILQINAATNLAMAQSFYEILLDNDIDYEKMKNIKEFIDAIQNNYKFKDSLFVFKDVDIKNKFFRYFVEACEPHNNIKILATSRKTDTKTDYVMVNYDDIKLKGIKKGLRMSQDLIAKFKADFETRMNKLVTKRKAKTFSSYTRLPKLFKQ